MVRVPAAREGKAFPHSGRRSRKFAIAAPAIIWTSLLALWPNAPCTLMRECRNVRENAVKPLRVNIQVLLYMARTSHGGVHRVVPLGCRYQAPIYFRQQSRGLRAARVPSQFAFQFLFGLDELLFLQKHHA